MYYWAMKSIELRQTGREERVREKGNTGTAPSKTRKEETT
jgi:hypothetical protein